jgi:Flp pilus assembly protein TadD
MDRVQALTELVSQQPEDTFARYGLAMALAAAGRDEDSLVEYTTLIAKSPDYVPAYQMSAQTLLKLGRTAEAKQRLESGLAAADRTGNSHAASELGAMLDDLR